MTHTLNIDLLAKQAANNHSQFKSFGWHEKPDDPENWTIVYTHNRDSRLLEESNAEAIAKVMEKEEFENDVISQRHNHWAVGWVDGYVIRVYREDGSITDAFRAWCELSAQLQDYPVLDEEDYSRREHEATLENVENAASRFVSDNPPEDWVVQLYDWLAKNQPGEVESRDDQGGYPSEETCKEALWEMNILDEYYWPSQVIRCKVCGCKMESQQTDTQSHHTLPEHAPIPDEQGYALSVELGGKPCLGSGLDGLVEDMW